MTSLDLIFRLCSKLAHRERLPKITMVGDQNQLPPIGNGSPFREFLKVPEIPRIVLTKNHRLETDDPSEHGIMQACDQVLEAPPCHIRSSESFAITYGGEETVKQLFQQFKDEEYDQGEVVCITPYKEAVKQINDIASKIWHPDDEHTDPAFTIRHVTWRLGDKVMVLVNLYNISVMNGETGIIEKIDESYVYVAFQDGKKKAQFRYVIKPNEDGEEEYDFGDDQDFNGNDVEMNSSMLSHAYAMTVHKAQGSEFNYCIYYFPYVQSKGLFITKELIYTMFSRGKVAGFLILPQGQLKTLEWCCSKSAREMRLDALSLRMKKMYEEIQSSNQVALFDSE
jgi:exodeoxyribonuclease V alpha subunit